MSFLGPLLAVVGSTFIPKVASWIGKKIAGHPLGNAAQNTLANNVHLKQAF